MLKKRIIPTMLWNGKTLVKGKKFHNDRKAGSPITTIQIYNKRDVDEILFLNIEKNNYIDKNFFKELTTHCNVPITIGGGIREISQISNLLESGADKISINTSLYENDKLISKAAKYFGSQTLVASIDYKIVKNKIICFSNNGKTKIINKDFINLCKEVQDRGAGEIIINNIEHDGLMNGYDIKTLKILHKNIKIPIIVSGGAGSKLDFKDAFKAGASGTCASSIFIFTETTPNDIKNYLLKNKIPVRKPTYAKN